MVYRSEQHIVADIDRAVSKRRKDWKFNYSSEETDLRETTAGP